MRSITTYSWKVPLLLMMATAGVVISLVVRPALPQAPLSSKAAAPAKAANNPTSVQIQTRDFLIYASQIDGKAQPRFVVRADYLKYPANLSFRKFIPQGAPHTPEENTAAYLQFWGNKKAVYAEFRSLWESKLHKTSEKDLRELFQSVRGPFPQMQDVIFKDRFDVGSLSFLAGDIEYAPKAIKILPQTYSTTKQVGNRSYSAEHSIFDVNEVTYAFGMASNEALSNHPATDWKLPYKVQLPSPEPGDPLELHPLYVLFEGKPLHWEIDDAKNDQQADTAILKFALQAFKTYRTGTQKQWLELWTDTDVKKHWNEVIKTKPQDPRLDSDYKLEKDKFSSDAIGDWRVFFVMDLGKNAIVFFEDRRELNLEEDLQPLGGSTSEIEMMYLLKKGADYRLTIGQELPNGTETLSGYLKLILESEPFMAFLKDIAKQTLPAAKKASEKASPEKAAANTP